MTCYRPEVIEAVNTDKPGFGIERATGKNYKYYLRTPENPQVKFYVPHIPKEQFEVEKLAVLNDKLASALRKSNEASHARFRIDS